MTPESGRKTAIPDTPCRRMIEMEKPYMAPVVLYVDEGEKFFEREKNLCKNTRYTSTGKPFTPLSTWKKWKR